MKPKTGSLDTRSPEVRQLVDQLDGMASDDDMGRTYAPAQRPGNLADDIEGGTLSRRYSQTAHRRRTACPNRVAARLSALLS